MASTAAVMSVVVSVIISCLSSSYIEMIHAAEPLVPALFVFGDSLVDVGNNNHIRLSLVKANFPHNGVDYPGGKATGRFSNGRNSADFLAQKLGFASSPPPFLSLNAQGMNISSILSGVNFASGGAGILDENNSGSISLNKQIENYATVYGNLAAQLGSENAATLVSKSLVLIVLGSNDLIAYFKSKSQFPSKYTPQQYIDLLVSTLKAQLQRIYNLGARRLVYGGVGAIGCSPSQRSKKNNTGGCVDVENDLALNFNVAIKSLLQDLIPASLPGLKYALCNTYGVISNYIHNPTSYGFKNVMDACCGAGNMNARIPCIPVVKYCSNRSEYVFWDLYHPTEIVSRMLTDTFFDGSANETSPINVRQLIAAS